MRQDARRDAWLTAGALALGVLLGRWSLDPLGSVTPGLAWSPVLFALAGLCAGLVLLVPPTPARALALIGVLASGAGLAHARLGEAPRDHLSRLVAASDPAEPATLVRLRGTVLDAPRARRATPGTLDERLTRFRPATPAFTLDADTLVRADAAVRISGSVRVYASGADDLRAGDRVEVLGLLSGIRPAMNPGAPDALAWARQAGRAGTLRTRAQTIEILEPGGPVRRARAIALRSLARFRAGAGDLIDPGAPGAGVAQAMLLGERGDDARDDAAFARTGVSHLLAISGFHLGVLAMLTVGIVRTTGDRPRLEGLVGIAVVVAYCALVPVRTPILRAAILTIALLAGRAFARRYDRMTMLGWTTAALIALRPVDPSTLGFQLTVGVTALLIWISETHRPWVYGRATTPHPALLGERGEGRAALVWVRGLVATSFMVWFVSAPAILWHTGSFNPLTPIAVIAATPLAVCVQALGIAGLLAHLASGPVGAMLIDAALLAARGVESVSGAFAAVGAHSAWPPVSLAWALGATGATLLVLARPGDRRPWLAVAGVLVWFGIEAHAARGLDAAARVDMLSVDDGSCLLVRAGGDAVLWDAGSLRPGIGVREIPRALRALGAPRVRTALVTHANIDHYAALPDAARAIGLRRVLVSAPALASMRAAPDGSAELMFLRAMDAQGVRVEAIAQGDTLEVGDATLRVLWPSAEAPTRIREANDRSLVARLEVPTRAGERRVLLVGDIQRAAMAVLLGREGETGNLLGADIAELAHHGSHHAVAEDFLLAVRPRVVLQSTGRSRAFDRRWNRVKRELGAAWGITARDGALWARIERDGGVSSGARLSE